MWARLRLHVVSQARNSTKGRLISICAFRVLGAYRVTLCHVLLLGACRTTHQLLRHEAILRNHEIYRFLPVVQPMNVEGWIDLGGREAALEGVGGPAVVRGRTGRVVDVSARSGTVGHPPIRDPHRVGDDKSRRLAEESAGDRSHTVENIRRFAH